MKKIIFLISILISGNTYSQCVIGGTTVIGTTKANKVQACEFTIQGMANSMLKSVSGVITPAVAGTDYEPGLTFASGLTRTSNTIRLGGTLTQNTNILGAGYEINFGTVASKLSSAYFNFDTEMVLKGNDGASNESITTLSPYYFQTDVTTVSDFGSLLVNPTEVMMRSNSKYFRLNHDGAYFDPGTNINTSGGDTSINTNGRKLHSGNGRTIDYGTCELWDLFGTLKVIGWGNGALEIFDPSTGFNTTISAGLNTNNRNFFLPDTNGTAVLNDNIATITNKTIDGSSNTLANIPQSAVTNLTTDLSGKQATLVSGTNIKTVNGSSLLGSGNLVVGGGDLLSTNNLSDVANASTARTNLGLQIGVNVQAYAANLTSWAALVPGDLATVSNLTGDITSVAGVTTYNNNLPDAKLSANVSLKNVDNVFSGNNSFTSASLANVNFTAGSNTTIADNVSSFNYNPATLQATATITMPATPTDGQLLYISFGGSIAANTAVVTTLTISPNAGQTIYGTITPVAAFGGDELLYQYNSSTTTWKRKK